MRKLVVTADDFGLSLAVSKGIIETMQEGIVSETCVMTNSPYFLPSIELAKEKGIEKMGVHLTATCLQPLDKALLDSVFVDENGHFSKKWLRTKLSDKDIILLEKEFTCQIEQFLATGLNLTHLNSHHGLSNADSRIKQLFERLSQQYDVPCRNEAFDKLVILNSSQSSEEVLKQLESVDGEYVELCAHPGYVDAALIQLTSMLEQREQDLAFLINPVTRQTVLEKFELVAFDAIKEV